MATAQEELLSKKEHRRSDPSQPTLFPLPEPEANEDAQFPNSEALLSLFYYSTQGLDHAAFSLCVRHFQPLSCIFQTKEEQLKSFFNRHGHVGGYLASRSIANPKQQQEARRYAAKLANLLAKRIPGALLVRTDPDFPKELSRARLDVNWIFCHPKRFVLPPSPRIAIVGSRKSTPQQLDTAMEIARRVNELGGVVVTGMAAGADAAAYEAVCDKERAVIGVLGTGIQKMYPANHKPMVEKLCRNGGFVLSELPPDFPGNRLSFILRNRIIATLSDLVVAVSGKYASGTSHTIRFANESAVRMVSADPDERSGITQLVQELGGQTATVVDIAEMVQRLRK